jgi:hypothetical protein
MLNSLTSMDHPLFLRHAPLYEFETRSQVIILTRFPKLGINNLGLVFVSFDYLNHHFGPLDVVDILGFTSFFLFDYLLQHSCRVVYVPQLLVQNPLTGTCVIFILKDFDLRVHVSIERESVQRILEFPVLVLSFVEPSQNLPELRLILSLCF